jgi:hypothetical protein
MDAVDGNAIAGLLQHVFGAEMTNVSGICESCHARMRVAELRVYVRAPGTVARCPSCESVVMVFTEFREITCVDLRGIEMRGR